MIDSKNNIDAANTANSERADEKQSGTQVRCIIEITQPDGNVIQVETSALGMIPELEKIDLTTKKSFMDFISMADKGIVAIKTEAGKKALEAYAKEALKKTDPEPSNEK